VGAIVASAAHRVSQEHPAAYTQSIDPTMQKAHHDGRAFSKLLVAWGGIEPPTQGFSTLSDRVKPVVQLAFLFTSVFGV
jgi:hypothetical protein